MLILTRKVGERLVIGDVVTVTVLGVKGNQIRVGIAAGRVGVQTEPARPPERRRDRDPCVGRSGRGHRRAHRQQPQRP